MVTKTSGKKKINVERQVRWNKVTNIGEQEVVPYRWTFMIINEPTEIERIRQRVYDYMEPVDEPRSLDEGLIEGSRGLHYDFFSFSTDKSRINNPGEIYGGRFLKDRDLIESDEVGLARYLEPILKGRK